MTVETQIVELERAAQAAMYGATDAEKADAHIMIWRIGSAILETGSRQDLLDAGRAVSRDVQPMLDAPFTSLLMDHN
jgi:hypothetical protein